MRYEVELDCRSDGKHIEIIEASDDAEAHVKARAWARDLPIDRTDCWLIVKNADGRLQSFKPGEI